MTVIVTIIEVSDPTVSETMTEIMLLRAPNQARQTIPSNIETGGQMFR